MTSDIVAAAEPVVVAFEELGVSYRIGGSVASSALGLPRSTLDVDLVCDLGPQQVDAFVVKLSAGYYVDADMVREAIARRASFNLVHLATMVCSLLDVQIPGKSKAARLVAAYQRWGGVERRVKPTATWKD